MTSAFLFHRSLRLPDNLGLLKALKSSQYVLPIFCVDPRQASEKNQFFSAFSLGFMLQSLTELQQELQSHGSDLLLLEGEPHHVLPQILLDTGITRLYMNRDFTPFAQKRKVEIERALSGNVTVTEVDDYLLFQPGSVLTRNGAMYRVYTPFYEACKGKHIDKPLPLSDANRLMKREHFKSLITSSGWEILQKKSKISPGGYKGGRSECLKILSQIHRTQRHYQDCRDHLTYPTSLLSAYIKFGCVSIREVWEGLEMLAIPASIGLRKQLMWREFFYHYYIAFPSELEWERKTEEPRLCDTAPGIVKACFRELDITGYLNNRGRLILAHYILHHQGEYWKLGDMMFARRLIDYDPFVNIGNWRSIEKRPKHRRMRLEVQYDKWDKDYPMSVTRKGKGQYTKFWIQPKEEIEKQLSSC